MQPLNIWNGFPKNPEQDSTGHVMRVDGRLGVFSWISAKQWFEDEKSLWVAPADLVDDGDEYLGQLVPSVDDIVKVERGAGREDGYIAGLREAARMADRVGDDTIGPPNLSERQQGVAEGLWKASRLINERIKTELERRANRDAEKGSL